MSDRYAKIHVVSYLFPVISLYGSEITMVHLNGCPHERTAIPPENNEVCHARLRYGMEEGQFFPT